MKIPSAQISRQYLEGVSLRVAALHLHFSLTDFFQENDSSILIFSSCITVAYNLPMIYQETQKAPRSLVSK